MRIVSIFKSSSAVIAFFIGAGIAAESVPGREKSQTKNITVIAAEGKMDGGSEVRKELLAECIVSLPSPGSLGAEVMSQTGFLRGINGDSKKNEHVKTYTARLSIPYLLYQKELIIVTTRSVQGQEPVMKEVERSIRQLQEFNSNPSDGDIFAGRSDRRYYFSNPELATKDVMARAETWLSQQSHVLCRD